MNGKVFPAEEFLQWITEQLKKKVEKNQIDLEWSAYTTHAHLFNSSTQLILFDTWAQFQAKTVVIFHASSFE